MSLVLIFWGGFFARGLWPSEYIVPITVYAPHNMEDMILMRWVGEEFHCYIIE